MLVKYVRDEDRNPVGCIVSLDKNLLGWSLCSPQDKFSKKIAKKIAIGRALKSTKIGVVKNSDYWRDWILSSFNLYEGKHQNPHIPKIITELYEQDRRSESYFKEVK